MAELDNTILKGLLHDEEFLRKSFPFMRDEYFAGAHKEVFGFISDYVSKYNQAPTKDELIVSLEQCDLDEQMFDDCCDVLAEVTDKSEDGPKTEWLLDEAEKYCQDKAIYNAVKNSVQILDGRDKVLDKHAIPELLKTALGVTFDSNIGHDYFSKTEEQYNFYHDDESKFPFDIEMLNKITNGGVPNKTLNVFLAGINVGKTIWLCHTASHWLTKGKNVLVISLETPEEAIRQRIDANLLQTNMSDITQLSKDDYMSKVNRIRKKTCGELIIKEYPAGQAHAGHFRHLINELKLKKNFTPDVICIDYLGICASQTLKLAQAGNTNTYYTEVAKELHALAKEFNLPVWTAHQYGRQGQNTSDVDMTDVSQAIGIAATADFIIAGISDEELEERGQLIIKQLKNRYNSKAAYRKFVVGIDRAKMTYYDAEPSAQSGLSNAGIPDNVPQQSEHSQLKKSTAQWSF